MTNASLASNRGLAVTPALAVQIGIGALAAAVGLPLLLAPASVARWLGLGDRQAGAYGLRIAGMMLSMLGLLLVMFAAVVASAAPYISV